MLIDSCKSDRGHILKKMNLQVIHDNISIMSKQILKILKILIILSAVIWFWIWASLNIYFYDIPDGYSKDHYSYEEALEYAHSIDPNAEVDETYIETDYSHSTLRIWKAHINGRDVHVASYPQSVMGKAIWESPISIMMEAYSSKDCYYLTTDDYLYTIMPIFKHYPELGEVSINMEEYNSLTSSRQFNSITKDELRELWDEYSKVTDDLKYNKHPIQYNFYFTTGGKDYCFNYVSDYEYDQIYRDIFYP